MANCDNCIKENDCCSAGKMSGFCGGYNPVKVTNKEYFFGDKMLLDTIMLLTYDDHPRKECRMFKDELKRMPTDQLREWLDAEKDVRFKW